MIIGIPKESKPGEKRVALTPEGTKELCELGAEVVIEASAGELSGFSDSDYSEVGARILGSKQEVWGEAELLVKVKEPSVEEYAYFREDLSVFCFFHLAALPELADNILKSKVTALDYDLLAEDSGRLPILEPMSVIAGKLAVQCGAHALQAENGGSGMLLGGAQQAPAARVTVIGVGAAGKNAALVASGMGAKVRAVDINEKKLEQLKKEDFRVETILSTPESLLKAVAGADLLIAAVLIPGALAPKLITRAHLKQMSPNSVLVDICIDQGGASQTSRPTSIFEPTYKEENILHYCVPNMPALVPKTSTLALTSASLPWLKLLAGRGIENCLNSSKEIKRSLISKAGKLTNKEIIEALNSHPQGYN